VKYSKIAAQLNPGESEVILSARHKHRLFMIGQSNKKKWHKTVLLYYGSIAKHGQYAIHNTTISIGRSVVWIEST
jgi:hypothetical protein